MKTDLTEDRNDKKSPHKTSQTIEARSPSKLSATVSLSLSVLTAFPGESELAGFTGAKDDGTVVVVTIGAIRHAKLQSNHHHHQTNTQLFTGWMPFLSTKQQCQSDELLQKKIERHGTASIHRKVWGSEPECRRT